MLFWGPIGHTPMAANPKVGSSWPGRGLRLPGSAPSSQTCWRTMLPQGGLEHM